MNPVLFDKDATEFGSQGIGTLDCVSCLVTEERNGIYELVARIRMESRHYEDVKEGNIIAATHSNKHDRQPFQIYKVTRTMDGYAEIRAEHISYRLNKNTVMPYTADNARAAIMGLRTNAVDDCPFTFITDKDESGSFKVSVPASIKSRLTGSEGSLTDIFKGGEYEYDNFTVKWLKDRGEDNGVSIRYGKNMTELAKESDISDIYTSIVPYWMGVDEDQNDMTVTLPENAVDSDYVSYFPTRRTVPVDLSGEFEDMPTVAQLRSKAQSYVNDNVRKQLIQTIQTKFVELAITDEYKDKIALESVNLCDTVTVSFPALQVSDKTKVTKIVYNTLLDRNESVELGDLKKTLGDLFVRKPGVSRPAAKQMVLKEKEVREREIRIERETSEREIREERETSERELREAKEELERELQEAKEGCEEKLKELEEKMDGLSFEFPIGYVYLSVTNVNPGEYFKGTWERISEGYYLRGVEGNDPAEEIGGDINGHKHDFSVSWKNFIQFNVGKGNMEYYRLPTEAAIPGNVKGQTIEGDPLQYVEVNIADNTPGITVDINQNAAGQRGSSYTGSSWKTTNVGETEPAFAEPPYFTVYVWKRVA